MEVGLVQVDGKFPNLALMRIAAWHKQMGDTVKWYTPIFGRNCDLVYASKIFSFTPNYRYLPEDAICGGSGVSLDTVLPKEIEECAPDYSIYPDCDFALGFTARGCVRNCPFCIVPVKEGSLRVVGDLYSFWKGQKKVIILDNNLTAAPWSHYERVMKQLIKEKVLVDFTQGFDVRLLTEDHAKLMAKVRPLKQFRFAWDRLGDEESVRRGINILRKYISLKKVMFYVLIGYDTTPDEDMYRVSVLKGLGVSPFVMPHNKNDPYQSAFSRWVVGRP
jgi:hypothetical protein